MFRFSTTSLTTLLVLTASSLITVQAQTSTAPSQAQIVNCQNSISIPSYQDTVNYDVSDTSKFTVTYTYNPQYCVGVPVASIRFTDYTSGGTLACTYAQFSQAGTYTSTCPVTKGSMAQTGQTAGADGADFSTTLRFGVKPTLYNREDIFTVMGSDASTITSTSAPATSTSAAATSTTSTGTSTITSPPSSPSEMKRRKRRALTAAQVDLSSTICDKGYSACPLKSKTGWLTKCIDTTSELYACGGCPGLPGTKDCTELVGVADVQCVQSTCQIERCDRAHKLSADGKSCVPKDLSGHRGGIY